jgi:hypothetical protein
MKKLNGSKYLWIFLALCTLASLVSACGIRRSELLGQWLDTSSGISYEFTEQGKLILAKSPSPQLQEMDFQFQNDTTLLLSGGTIITYRVEANILTLNINGQVDLPLTRMR